MDARSCSVKPRTLCTSRHLRAGQDRLCGHGPVLRLCTASRASCCSSTISPSKLAFTNHRDQLGDSDTCWLQGEGDPERHRGRIPVFFTQLESSLVVDDKIMMTRSSPINLYARTIQF
jgi:hypothetical protein